ncbi:S-protein-like protein 5-like [Senna tora]|uniref:S-protein homolog n=1 Tax=Senna tora TaxID=362788 RepID=A0A834WDM5_9FABA|nr:S-protein-like protein 5-like [Senna tora]
MGLRTKSLVLVVLITMVIINGRKAWILIPPKVTVSITNIADQDLTLHCKSKTEDLGVHTIKLNESYEFKFKPAPFLDITLYFCGFRWSSERKGGKAWILIPPEVTVSITNIIDRDLTLHCKSKTEDLGVHTIKLNESYEFKFKPAPVLDITLYFCGFRWSFESETTLHRFDIYEERRDQWCTKCSWQLMPAGPCLNAGPGKIKCYDWK